MFKEINEKLDTLKKYSSVKKKKRKCQEILDLHFVGNYVVFGETFTPSSELFSAKVEKIVIEKNGEISFMLDHLNSAHKLYVGNVHRYPIYTFDMAKEDIETLAEWWDGSSELDDLIILIAIFDDKDGADLFCELYRTDWKEKFLYD